MNNRCGKVYVQDIYAGKIAEDDDGYVFSYDPGYLSQENAVPVSLTIPLTSTAYRSGVLFPFFDGLIPEGWLLEVVERNWKLNANDRLGISQNIASNMITRCISKADLYIRMIEESRLSEEMKLRFAELIRERCSRIN